MRNTEWFGIRTSSGVPWVRSVGRGAGCNMPLLRQAGEHIDAPAVARFVDRIDSFRKVEDARVRRGTQDAKTALDRAIAGGRMTADVYAVATFEEFWPHYVGLQTRPETHALHAVATLSCVALLAAAVVLRQPLLVLAAPLADHAVAQISHRLLANRTTPWKNPPWHARAELRMLRLVLTGRMAAEVARVA